LIQSKIDADKGGTQRSTNTAAVRSPSTDSNTGKTPSGVWDQLQRPVTVISSPTALSGPDFPPLQPSTAPAPMPLAKSISRKMDSDKRSVSQDSVDNVQRTESESLESMPVPMQSASSVSSATVSIAEQSVEFPQYELFGTASPAISAAMATRSRSDVGNGIKPLMQCPSGICQPSFSATSPAVNDIIHEPFTNSGAQQGVCSMHQTENTSYSVHCSGPAIPVMIMSGGYTPMGSYGSGMMQPAPMSVVSMNSAMGHDIVPHYAMYSCPPGPSPVYAPMHGVSSQYTAGHSPPEPVALQVAMECLNSDGIADKLPKEIPGLVESDQDESAVPYHSYGYFPVGSPMESSGGLPRHLLGELESELEV